MAQNASWRTRRICLPSLEVGVQQRPQGPESTQMCQLTPLRTAGSHGLESSSPPSGSEVELPPTLCTFYLESGCSKWEDCVWFNANLAFTSQGWNWLPFTMRVFFGHMDGILIRFWSGCLRDRVIRGLFLRGSWGWWSKQCFAFVWDLEVFECFTCFLCREGGWSSLPCRQGIRERVSESSRPGSNLMICLDPDINSTHPYWP